MRKGTIAAKALTLLLAVGMLSQNVVTVYADEEGGETPAETTYTITYQVEDAAQGSVRLNKDGAESKESDTETVTVTVNEDGGKSYSEVVGAVAEAADADQYTFVNWTAGDEVVATDASYKPSVETLSGDVTYTAHFSKKENNGGQGGENGNPVTTITISYAVNDAAMGTASNAQDMKKGDESTIEGSTATANTGYKFVGWKKGAEEDYVSTDAAFTPTEWPSGDVTYTAYFEAEARTQEDDNLVPTNDAVPTVADGKAYVVSTQIEYETLDVAMAAAATTDTIYLGKGSYYGTSQQSQKGSGAGKSLTFIGSSQSDTIFEIQNAEDYSVDRHANYAFDGSDSITFKNLTLRTPSNQYDSGYVRVKHMTLDNCVFDGRGDYWGTESTTFRGVTFNPQDEKVKIGPFTINKNDYSVYTKTGSIYTFEDCIFNSKGGKAVNVYKDGAIGNDTIYFKNCTVNNQYGVSDKQILRIDDRYHSATIYISGDSVISGSNVQVDNISCSRLYGFGREASLNAGNTTVYIEGNKVFEKGKLIDHEHGTISDGSYSNGKASNSNYAYSEGYKDNAYTTTEGEWETQADGTQIRKITKTCDYCDWSSDGVEKKVPSTVEELPADLRIDTGDGVNTEHDAVVVVKPGQSVDLIGALKVSAVLDQMEAVEKQFPATELSIISIKDLDYGFTAVLTIPEGMTLPQTVTISQSSGLAETFKAEIDATNSDARKVTVKFTLTDKAKNDIDTYHKLKDYVKAAGVDGWITVTIPGVTIDTDVADGKQLTVYGTVAGTFQGTAKGSYTTYTFPYTWTGVQDAAGKDAAAGANDDSIRLTVKVVTEKTDITGTVTWNDADNKDGVRPEKVTIRVYSVDANGNKTEVKSVESTDGTFSFKDLPVYDASGNAITYTVAEDAIDEYTTTVSGDAKAGFTIVNKHVPAAPKTPSKDKTDDQSDDKPHKHHDKSSSKTVTPAQTTPTQTPADATVVTPAETTPAPAADAVQESGAVVSTEEASINTGDDSMMALYAGLFLAAAAGLIVWSRKARV